MLKYKIGYEGNLFDPTKNSFYLDTNLKFIISIVEVFGFISNRKYLLKGMIRVESDEAVAD